MKRDNIIICLLFFLNTLGLSQNTEYKVDTTVTGTDSCIHSKVLVTDKNNQIVDMYEYVYCYYLTGEKKENYSSRLNYGKNGVYYSLYKNGNIKEFYFLINGRRTGNYIKNNEDGTPLIVGNYKTINCLNEIQVECDTIVNSKLDESNGTIVTAIECGIKSIKEGEWKYWNSSGELIRIEYWENGTLLREEKY